MQWSRVFLFNKSFTTFSGGHNARALLFPMEKVFESYVAQQLKKALLDLDWELSTQDRGFYLFDSPRQFALRPDIVITRSDETRVILDTKWKSLVDRPGVNYGISQADMYQMYAYHKKYKPQKVILLYPDNQAFKENERVFTYLANEPESVEVCATFFDLLDVIRSLEKIKELIK